MGKGTPAKNMAEQCSSQLSGKAGRTKLVPSCCLCMNEFPRMQVLTAAFTVAETVYYRGSLRSFMQWVAQAFGATRDAGAGIQVVTSLLFYKESFRVISLYSRCPLRNSLVCRRGIFIKVSMVC